MVLNNFKIIKGRNLSGRTNLLQDEVSGCEVGSYIGPLANNYISGLAPTVKSELKLHFTTTYEKIVSEKLREFDFDKLLNQNPFTLSGGQQVLLNVLSSLYLAPEILAIDTSLEQLSYDNRKSLIDLFYSNKLSETKILLADNRIQEIIETNSFNSDVYHHITTKPTSSNKFYNIVVPDRIFGKDDEQTLIVKGLNFAYEKKRIILKDVNVKFSTGQLYLIDGTNGAGKTTFAKLLSGVLKPQKGTFILNNNEIIPFSTPGKYVGYSFQNPTEQIFMNTVKTEIAATENESNHTFYAKWFGLTNCLEENPFSLPLVIQKRLTLASTLAMNRNFVIFDEPTLLQDDINARSIAKTINLLTKSGKCVILISHSLWFRKLLNYKKITISNGKLTCNEVN